jgi:ArsR family transcriptional regulator
MCELATALDLTQPTISRHLKVLRGAGIIGSQRRSTWVTTGSSRLRWSA